LSSRMYSSDTTNSSLTYYDKNSPSKSIWTKSPIFNLYDLLTHPIF